MSSSAAEQLTSISFEDYLEAEKHAEGRHEWVGGRVYVMSGGSERHALVAGLVSDTLRPQARERGCRTFIADRMVRPGDVAYYPDFLVVCGPAGHLHHETDAALIVEVLSPTTGGIDRREKAMAYSTLPGLEQYLLIDPVERRIEVARFGPDGLRWEAFGSGDVVLTAYGDLVVDDLYDELDAEATT